MWVLGHDDRVADGKEKKELLHHGRHRLGRVFAILHQDQDRRKAVCLRGI